MCLVAYSQMLFTKTGPFPAVIFEPNPYHALRKPLPFIFKPTCSAGKQRLWTAVLAFVVREREAVCAAWHGGLARILRSEAAEFSSLGWFLLASLEIREIDTGDSTFCCFLAPSPFVENGDFNCSPKSIRSMQRPHMYHLLRCLGFDKLQLGSVGWIHWHHVVSTYYHGGYHINRDCDRDINCKGFSRPAMAMISRRYINRYQ